MTTRRASLAAAVLPALLAGAAAAAPPPPRGGGATGVETIDTAGYARLLSGLEGKVVVVNFWATWCEPCREEFPDLLDFARRMRPRGVMLVTVSLDLPAALEEQVVPFLRKQGADVPAYIKAPGDDDAFINGVDPAWSGALPATFVYDREGRRIASQVGPTDATRLNEVVAPLLDAPPRSR